MRGDPLAVWQIEFPFLTILIWKIRLKLLIPARHRVPAVMRESVYQAPFVPFLAADQAVLAL